MIITLFLLKRQLVNLLKIGKGMLFFFTDIHGNLGAFNKFIAEIDRNKDPQIIFGGDVLGYYYNPNEILDELRKRKIKSVLGNHDQYFLDLLDGKISEETLINRYGTSYKNLTGIISKENITFLRSLPKSLDLTINDKRIYVVHGSPENELNGRIYPDSDLGKYSDFFSNYDLVLLGHSHHKMQRKLNRTLILNPGSLGQQRDGKGCSYAIIDIENLNVDIKVVSYDINALVKEVREKDPDKVTNLEVLTRIR